MSVGRNYLYNLIYQILLVFLPIITVPYVTRVLGSNGVGIYAYTSANIQYFILFGTLGIALYGNRTVAYVRDDKEKLSNAFWSILLLKSITTSVVYVIFVIIFSINKNQFNIYYWIQSINIIAAAVDISWLFMGIEDFKKTVTRNLLIKIISMIAIFTLVKTSNDLWIYILITVMSNFLGQAVLWIYVPNVVNYNKISFKDIKKHIIPVLRLFIPTIATQIYCIFDKTLLGYFSSTNEVGFYDMGQKIVYMSLTFITSMGTVMLPRITNIFARGDMKKINVYLIKTFNFTSYISIPMMLGLMSISNGFSSWFFGSGFSKSGSIMMIESPIIILIGWSNVIGIQYMIPLGKVNEITLSVTVGAIVDIMANLLLTKSLFSIGAAISTVLAEIAVTIMQIYLMRDKLPFKEMFEDIWKYSLAGLTMYLIISLFNNLFVYCFVITIIQIIIGIIVYFIMLLILKSNFQSYVVRIVREKIMKKVSK